MIVDTQEKLKELYEIDDHLWLEETVKLLKEKQFHQLDLENLIEELESLAKRDKLALQSLLEQIIRHLLLLQYWHEEREKNYRHWESEVISFRSQINKRITTNFYNYLNTNLAEIYQDARLYVIVKSGLDTFPSECPYNLDELLNKHWFPEI
ncbi:DUF29 domain-containing protein [Geminocystis sp. GBBB08]|uniref:DUF29 domain-containing protein n=1 Tax=Geminocystis sp. GBBB08 TaxID=2604140 RepID=UPI0027E3891F|nr:DUF29 domain-containing protein [Geminocystis sp. GBBB08]MBL1210350.1 DUF29 domain-containing protein [Geminocystis sp. GBBB08]